MKPDIVEHWPWILACTLVLVISLASLSISLYVYFVGRQLIKDAVKLFGSEYTCSGNEDGDVKEVSSHVRHSLNNRLGIDLSDSEAQTLTHTLIGILVVRKRKVEKQGRVSIVEAKKKSLSIAKQIMDFTMSAVERATASSNSSSDLAAQETTPLLPSLSLSPTVYLQNITQKATRASGEQHDTICIPLMELDNHDVLPNLLKYLPFEDLNSLAICNKRLQNLRADPSLDQTRSGVLVFRGSNGDSLFRLDHVIAERNLGQVFQGNRTCLRLKNFVKNLDDFDHPTSLHDYDFNQLSEVTQLLLVNERSPSDPHVGPSYLVGSHLPRIFPNITHLDCSFSKDTFFRSISLDKFKKLDTWTCNGGSIETCGRDLKSFKSIRCLYLEGSPGPSYYSEKNSFLYGFPRRMERLDIRRVKGYNARDVAILLQKYKHLRWVRCDISDRERATLLAQRPDVAIINW